MSGSTDTPPTIAELLDVDREFRGAAGSVDFILHTTRDGRRYTALFSRSSMARALGRERDWVVLDLEAPGPNPRWTVVTEYRGVLKRKRVVRGREVECFQYYRAWRTRRMAAGRSRAGTRTPHAA